MLHARGHTKSKKPNHLPLTLPLPSDINGKRPSKNQLAEDKYWKQWKGENKIDSYVYLCVCAREFMLVREQTLSTNTANDDENHYFGFDAQDDTRPNDGGGRCIGAGCVYTSQK